MKNIKTSRSILMKQINNRASDVSEAGYSTNFSSISNNINNNDLVLAPLVRYTGTMGPGPYKNNGTLDRSQKLHHVFQFRDSDKCFNITPSPDTSSTSVPPFQKYDVEILRDIELRHDVSVPGSWGGQIIVTISKNWNITVRFVTTDGWPQNNQWIYGRLWFKSGDNEVESDSTSVLLPMDPTISGGSASAYTSDVFYPNNNFRNNESHLDVPPRTTVDVKAFRQGNGDGNVIVGITGGELQSSTKQFRDYTRKVASPFGSIPWDKWYLNEKNYNTPSGRQPNAFTSIYILRYQVLLEGYYAGTRQDDGKADMRIHVSGDVKMFYNTNMPGSEKLKPYFFIREDWIETTSEPRGGYNSGTYTGYDYD